MRIGEALAKAGSIDHALKIAQEIEDVSGRDSLLLRIAIWVPESAELPPVLAEALAVARKRDVSSSPTDALQDTLSSLITAEKIEEALACSGDRASLRPYL